MTPQKDLRNSKIWNKPMVFYPYGMPQNGLTQVDYTDFQNEIAPAGHLSAAVIAAKVFLSNFHFKALDEVVIEDVKINSGERVKYIDSESGQVDLKYTDEFGLKRHFDEKFPQRIERGEGKIAYVKAGEECYSYTPFGISGLPFGGLTKEEQSDMIFSETSRYEDLTDLYPCKTSAENLVRAFARPLAEYKKGVISEMNVNLTYTIDGEQKNMLMVVEDSNNNILDFEKLSIGVYQK